MRIPTFATRLPLTVLRREVRYTLVQLRPRPWAKSWVTVFEGLLKEIEAALTKSGKLGDALDDAEAGVDYADEVLDWAVMRAAATARATLKGEVLAAFMSSLFGSDKPSDLVRPKLGPQLVRVRTWPAILKNAPEPLCDLLPTVTAAIAAADEAEQALSVAAGATEAFRASVHAPLVEKINGQRKALGGDAKGQAHDADGGTEQEGLFLVSAAESRRGARPASIEKTQAEIAALQADLALAQQRLVAQQAQQQADQKRQEVAQKVRDLQSARAQTDAQIAELQAQLHSARS